MLRDSGRRFFNGFLMTVARVDAGSRRCGSRTRRRRPRARTACCQTGENRGDCYCFARDINQPMIMASAQTSKPQPFPMPFARALLTRCSPLRRLDFPSPVPLAAPRALFEPRVAVIHTSELGRGRRTKRSTRDKVHCISPRLFFILSEVNFFFLGTLNFVPLTFWPESADRIGCAGQKPLPLWQTATRADAKRRRPA
jgi:hypothetical protein